MLCDDPNESSTVYLLTSDNKQVVCGTDFSPMQINFFAENISYDSSMWRRLSVMCQVRKMIKFHRCSFRNIKVKQMGQILFCNNPIFFFIIPKVCWTVCVFHFLNLESLRRIYVSLFTFRDFRHRRAMTLTTLKHSKTAERNPTTCECIFHQVAVKNVNVSVVKTIYCQRNLIFLRQKKIIVFIIWPARIGVCPG